MKNIILFLTIILFNSECIAQPTLLDISDKGGFEYVPGGYYADQHNLLAPFVGEYLGTSANKTLRIVLQKKTSSMNGLYTEDLIIGEYQYILNGQEKINTLDRLTLNYANKIKHSINGSSVMQGQVLGCSECGTNEKWLYLGIVDRNADNVGTIGIRKVIVGGQEAIKVSIRWYITALQQDFPFIPPTIPADDYTLFKL